MTADDASATGRPDHARLLSLAAHELRTPVSIVGGYLRMLVREGSAPLPAAQRTLVEQAIRSCTHLSALVDELGELGKLETPESPGSRDMGNLFAILRDAARESEADLRDGPAVVVELPDSPAAVRGDTLRLQRALGVIVKAVARERVASRSIVVRGTLDLQAGQAVVVVGTEEEVGRALDAALEPVDIWRGGLGLGLPIARHIVEHYGGTMGSVRGEDVRPGRGAVVLTLPTQGA